MNIVGRIQFPNTIDTSDLYMKCAQGAFVNYREGFREVVFPKGGIVSFNTYFNSVYEKFYTEYTSLDSIYYLLQIEGDFQVSIYREFYGEKNRELIGLQNFEKCQLSNYIKILLPSFNQNENSGRVYLEIMCLNDHGLLMEGLVATDLEKIREVSLGIVTCTFRKEAYVKTTVNSILQNSLLEAKDLKIFVVDNGMTLNKNEFKNQKVKLIYNKNVGGSGGFTRGLIEALREGNYTHFLFMDDDIELDSECIYKLFSLYEYAKTDFAVAGSMLDLHKKHILYEAGALFGKRCDRSNGYYPFSLAPLQHNLDLQNASSLNVLLLKEKLDFGGFWLFSFSKNIIEKIGFPMPFFIKIDDVEFGLRIKECFGGEIVAFPSIAVWHEPFYAKSLTWNSYYALRNYLITHSIRSSLGYTSAVKYFTKLLVASLLFFDYNSAEMIIKAFEDYMKGPLFIQNSDPEVLHSNVLELSKYYKSQTSLENYYSLEQFYQKSRLVSLKKIISLLTLNGHLLPNFLMTNTEAFVLHGSGHSGQWYKPLAKKTIIFFKPENNYFFQHQLDKLAGIKLLTRWLKVVITSNIKWSFVSAEWKNASKYLASTEFWQQYLGLKNCNLQNDTLRKEEMNA